MKRKIDPFDYASEIMGALKTGVLLTTKAGDRVNAMTVSWGSLGILWGKPTFTVYVREHRFTTTQLARNPQFTINVPVGTFDNDILRVCGTKSGHLVDKVGALGLSLVEPERIEVPGIAALPLTLECMVVYSQRQDGTAIPPRTIAKFYPQDVESTFHGSNRDLHTAYWGEIVSAYIAE
jgi:flavin reductase (DIM6/NTAB) family NADH-FMN oxidoreductase RutF